MVKLILVDLPGIIQADQDESKVSEIKRLVESYLRQEDYIILAISSASDDVANSTAIGNAKNFDPEGKRTVYVLTKIDAMERGTNALDILTGKNTAFPKNSIIICVKNRSQEEMEEITMEESEEEEKQFLADKYPSIAMRQGRAYLRSFLHRKLKENMALQLPRFRHEFLEQISEFQEKKKSYVVQVNGEEALIFILEQIQHFVSAMELNLSGNCLKISGLEDICGAKIRKLIHEQYKGEIMALELKLDPQLINQIISNSRAYMPTISVPHIALMNLVRLQIEQIKEPTVKIMESVKELLNECSLTCFGDLKQLHYFRLLYKLIKDEVENFISDKHQEALKFSICLIDIEISHLNIFELGDEGKMEESGKMLSECVNDTSSSIVNKSGQVQVRKEDPKAGAAPMGTTGASQAMASRQSLEPSRLCEIVKDQESLVKIIRIYFSRIKQRTSEIVAKAIVYHMVQNFSEQCGKYLQKQLLKKKDIADILKEDPMITQQRRCIEDSLARISKGLEAIDKIETTFG